MGFSSSRPLPFVALFMKPHVSWLTRARPQMKTAAASERPRNSSSYEPALNRRTSAAALRGAHTDAAARTGADLLQFRARLPVGALSDPWAACHEILADSPRNPQHLSRRAKFDFLMFEAKTARASRLFPAEQIRAVSAGFLDSSGPPPLLDFRVVSSDQNVGNGPAAIFRGTRVVWKIQQNMIRFVTRAHGRIGWQTFAE